MSVSPECKGITGGLGGYLAGCVRLLRLSGMSSLLSDMSEFIREYARSRF